MKTIVRCVRETRGLVAAMCIALGPVTLAVGCGSSQHPDLTSSEVLTRVERALEPAGQVTHLVTEDGERGLRVEVWLDSDGTRARADSTATTALITEGSDPRPAGYRISEIIANGETCDEIPSLSCANTADEPLSLALPWLGRDLPNSLKITADDGLANARSKWLLEDGEVAYFNYSEIHSSPAGLSIYEWPAGESGLHCSTEWPVSWTRDITTRFGKALFCDAQDQQLTLVIGSTMIRLVYSEETPDWFVARANALVALK